MPQYTPHITHCLSFKCTRRNRCLRSWLANHTPEGAPPQAGFLMPIKQDDQCEDFLPMNGEDETIATHIDKLDNLARKANHASRTKVVAHPYQLQPSLALTEWEQAMFDLYREQYLWKDPTKTKQERIVITEYL